MQLLSLFATAPKSMEPLLADELRELGMSDIAPTRAGVAFQGTLTQAYQVCLWSRIANRVLLPLATFYAPNPDALYQGVQTIQWDKHVAADGTLAVDFTSIHSAINHTHFGALKVKDAIVDQFRTNYQVRPNILLQCPDIRINAYLHHDKATISLDLSGESLHRRGYREIGVQAPLKENLAAAILLRAGWRAIAAQGGTLLDPMCGSGTLPIEAAFIAADIAPGLLREYFGFLNWRQHDATQWATLLAAAEQRKILGIQRLPTMIGYDADVNAIRVAIANVEKSGLSDKIHIERRSLAQLTLPNQSTAGLIVVNPPYGERLGNSEELTHLYHYFGETLKSQFQGWQAAVLAGNLELGKAIGIRARKMYTLYNGALECKLLKFDIIPEWFMHYHTTKHQVKPAAAVELPKYSDSVQMFANRLQKNLKTLGNWAKRENITCFRIYDADLPEYALAIDVYKHYVNVQEYAAPKTVDAHKAQTRLQEALPVIGDVLAIPKNHLFLKVRKPQKGAAQYEKFNETEQFYEVHEDNAIFLVNFTDYLDTGLFLDHRLTRQLIQSLASGKRFLNLFGYTGTATVHAALGGAIATTTIDMSKTYLAWARRNLARNGFSDHRHEFVQADCMTWLRQEKRRYGLIFLDPPTFSNSKSLDTTLDIQRDHVQLIRAALNCLTHDGILLFSTNHQRFKMDTVALADVHLENISAATLPKDFARSPRIHQCWKMTQF